MNIKNAFKSDSYSGKQFIVGLDLGNETSSISYFDVHRNTPEIVDVSGGYGKASLPTTLRYVFETKEWVVGEYALFDTTFGESILIDNLMDRLGENASIQIEGNSMNFSDILSIFINELLKYITNIDPNAGVAGIVVTVSGKVKVEALEEIKAAFKTVRYGEALIGIIPDRECVFERYFFGRKIRNEKILLLDYSSRELRAGIYEITKQKSETLIRCLSFLSNKDLGTKNLDSAVLNLFEKFYCQNQGVMPRDISQVDMENLKIFTFQHKGFLYQKNSLLKPARLYFNFAYPPFQKNITKEETDNLTKPFKTKFANFINEIFKTYETDEILVPSEEIDAIVCAGGGFEMAWVTDVLDDIFPDVNIIDFKNNKAIISEGAAITAATILGTVDETFYTIKDCNRLTKDIGVQIFDGVERFLPIIEKQNFWWEESEPKILIIDSKEMDKFEINLFTRELGGEVQYLTTLELTGLPRRPKGTNRIKLRLYFEKKGKLIIDVTDFGFGELFPKSKYQRLFSLMVDV